MQRGTTAQAGLLARTIIDTRDDVPITAHQVAASATHQLLPDMVARLLTRREKRIAELQAAHTQWRHDSDEMTATMGRSRTLDRSQLLDRKSELEL